MIVSWKCSIATTSGSISLRRKANKHPAEVKSDVSLRYTQLLTSADANSQLKLHSVQASWQFHRYQKIEAHCETEFYFATPSTPGRKAVTKILIDLFANTCPKQPARQCLMQQQCNQIADKLNSRPRKCHNDKTPQQMYCGI